MVLGEKYGTASTSPLTTTHTLPPTTDVEGDIPMKNGGIKRNQENTFSPATLKSDAKEADKGKGKATTTTPGWQKEGKRYQEKYAEAARPYLDQRNIRKTRAIKGPLGKHSFLSHRLLHSATAAGNHTRECASQHAKSAVKDTREKGDVRSNQDPIPFPRYNSTNHSTFRMQLTRAESVGSDTLVSIDTNTPKDAKRVRASTSAPAGKPAQETKTPPLPPPPPRPPQDRTHSPSHARKIRAPRARPSLS